jgi:3-hydroxy-9,10-secoandrosta-1,3,5(10)-triene-9,17-dione monooxygenase
LALIDGFTGKSPGLQVNPGPLYRLPFGQIFVRAISTSALGMAEGALAAYRDGIRAAVGRLDGVKLAEDPVAQVNVARAAATIHEVRNALHAAFTAMEGQVSRGERIPIEDRLRYRYESSLACAKCVEVVDMLFTATAARAVRLDSPLQRYFQDIHVARAHYANNPDKPARNFGLVELGGRNVDFFL